jgi:quercetin dioxygenase-like cupin family protein
MAKLIISPTIIKAAGNKPKEIREFIGRINTVTSEVSIAQMVSPAGWNEPGQRPEFKEYTIVLYGLLVVETRDKKYRVEAGQAIVIEKGEWVRYSTPENDGAQYISVCLPAFSPDTVHRD